MDLSTVKVFNNFTMSSELKKDNYKHSHFPIDTTETVNKRGEKKVDLNSLILRLNIEKKKEKRTNAILSAAAISTVAIFGIILTL